MYVCECYVYSGQSFLFLYMFQVLPHSVAYLFILFISYDQQKSLILINDLSALLLWILLFEMYLRCPFQT